MVINPYKIAFLILTLGLSLHVFCFDNKIDSLKFELKQSDSYDQYISTLGDLVFNLHYANSDSTISYCLTGVEKAKQHQDTLNIGFFHNVIGIRYKNQANFDSAIYHYNLSKKYRESINFKEGVAGVNNNLATVYAQKGDYHTAINLYLESLIIFEELKDFNNIGEVHSNIGELYIDLEEFKLAQDHFNLSQKFYQKNGNIKSFAWVYNDIGLLKTKMGELDSAIIYYEKSAEIWKSHERWLDYAKNLTSIGKIYLEERELSQAKFYLDEAEKLFKKEKYTFGLSEVNLLLGKYFKVTGQYQQAIFKYKSSLKISNYAKANGLLVKVYSELANCYALNHQFDSAYFYQSQYNEIKDSLFGIEQANARLKFQTEYGVLQKEKTIKDLENKTLIQELKNKQNELKGEKQKISIYALSFGVFITLAFLILLFNKNKQKTALNSQLKMALSEREVLLKEVHHRVKNNLQIVSSLLNLQTGQVNSKSAHEILKASQDRIRSMSLLHENLYKSKQLNDIDFKDYVDELTQNLIISFDLKNKNIQIKKDISGYNLSIDYLVPCGLIINELITNTLKYAFPNQTSGEIMIKGQFVSPNYILEISDNGIGFPKDMDIKDSKTIGLRLVNGLVRQIKGDLTWKNSTKGVTAQIKFKVV
ncbi:MAG: tetratricopeptide repeat-containing sensor histidine kinase [Putridiphycobacter sp.]